MLVLVMGGIYEVRRWGGLKWHDIVTYYVCVTIDGVWIGE
jgi:hypothetical protein